MNKTQSVNVCLIYMQIHVLAKGLLVLQKQPSDALPDQAHQQTKQGHLENFSLHILRRVGIINYSLDLAKTSTLTLKLRLHSNYLIDHHLLVFIHHVSNEQTTVKTIRQNLLEKGALFNILKDIVYGFYQSVQNALERGPLWVNVQNKLKRQKSCSQPCWEYCVTNYY